MSFSRMKPLPKFLIIGGGVVALVFGASLVMDKLPSKTADVQADPVTTTSVPAETAAPAQETSAPVAPPVQEAAPILQPAAPTDAGLANVLGAGKK